MREISKNNLDKLDKLSKQIIVLQTLLAEKEKKFNEAVKKCESDINKFVNK